MGPLASFSSDEIWVDHPYREGIALIGDAAAISDPIFGQGLSLTLRDVRVLRDWLLASEDWDTAAHAYAQEHDRYWGCLHTVTSWLRQLLLEQGDEAEARRARAFPLIEHDPTRVPDHTTSGPELPIDEQVRTRLFGEE